MIMIYDEDLFFPPPPQKCLNIFGYDFDDRLMIQTEKLGSLGSVFTLLFTSYLTDISFSFRWPFCCVACIITAVFSFPLPLDGLCCKVDIRQAVYEKCISTK